MLNLAKTLGRGSLQLWQYKPASLGCLCCTSVAGCQQYVWLCKGRAGRQERLHAHVSVLYAPCRNQGAAGPAITDCVCLLRQLTSQVYRLAHSADPHLYLHTFHRPQPFSSSHDMFLDNYVKTGQPKILDTRREVVAITKVRKFLTAVALPAVCVRCRSR